MKNGKRNQSRRQRFLESSYIALRLPVRGMKHNAEFHEHSRSNLWRLTCLSRMQGERSAALADLEKTRADLLKETEQVSET